MSGWRQVHRDPGPEPRQAAREQRGTHAVTRLAHGGVGETDDGEAGQARGHVDLDRETGLPSTPWRVAEAMEASTGYSGFDGVSTAAPRGGVDRRTAERAGPRLGAHERTRHRTPGLCQCPGAVRGLGTGAGGPAVAGPSPSSGPCGRPVFGTPGGPTVTVSTHRCVLLARHGWRLRGRAASGHHRVVCAPDRILEPLRGESLTRDAPTPRRAGRRDHCRGGPPNRTPSRSSPRGSHQPGCTRPRRQLPVRGVRRPDP